MNKKIKSRITSVIMTLMMVLSLIPANVMATTETGTVSLPTLKEGVSAEASAQVQVNEAYLLGELQSGRIFQPAEGAEALKPTNYYYEKSTDGGKNWSSKISFDEALFGGTTISIVEKTPGTYMYKFYASHDGVNMSTDTWTLTLNVVEKGTWNTKFYVGKDKSDYASIKLYKTAGVDKATGKDYVGWFTNGQGEKVLVIEPADFNITGNKADGYKADGYTLHDYEPIGFTDENFVNENESAEGVLVGYYNMFYAPIEAGRYSFRGYSVNNEKLGGMSIKIPADANVDGSAGGGTDIYLNVAKVYSSSKKADNTNFAMDELSPEVICPLMGCTATQGEAYKSGNNTYYPYLLYAGGNSCLYNFYMNPQGDCKGKYGTGFSGNQTIGTSYMGANKQITVSQSMKLTVNVPKDADFNLYYQWNNFNTKAVEPLEILESEDGKTTYTFNVNKGIGNYTWRLIDKSGKYVTKAGWLPSLSKDEDMDLGFDKDDEADKKSHSFNELGTTVVSRDEADIMANADPSGFKKVGSDESTRVRLYRFWEIINNDAANIMIEPDFNYQVLSGKADVDAVSGGNASGNWLDVDPNGTAIIAANYDAIDTNPDNHGTHGGLFPATSPERTAVFVVSDNENGSADADIDYNMPVGHTPTRSEDWDYNYDTWYYTKDDAKPTLEFNVNSTDDNVKVEYAVVTTDDNLKSTLSSWEKIEKSESGLYIADLLSIRNKGAKGGTVIIKMTDSTGVSYRLARVAEMKVEIENVSNPDEKIMPGDKVKLSFEGLYRAVNKVAGVFNPTTYYLRYTSSDIENNGQLAQYQKMDNATITITVPKDVEFNDGEETATYKFTNGYIFGSMYCAANPFGFLYGMTDTGVGTNFNAVSTSFSISRLADVDVEVARKAKYDVRLEVVNDDNESVEINSDEVVINDPEGNVVKADENGIYRELGYGSYDYVITKSGHSIKRGKFKLGSADISDVKDGILTKTLPIEKSLPGAWDGTSKEEPELVDGVYQISTGAELAWFADKVNLGSKAIDAKLVNDIDLSGYNWTQIGMTSSKPYAGNFDGNGYIIKNLYINYTKAIMTSPYLGLFGCVIGTANESASIENLKLNGTILVNNGKSVSNGYIGGLAGWTKYTDINNVCSDVDVTLVRTSGNWSYIGGLIGGSDLETHIYRCANIGDVKGYNYVGGLAGVGKAGCQIDESYNSGAISGNSYVGGIAGYFGSAETAATGRSMMSNCYSTGKIDAASYAGGLTGYLWGGANEYQHNVIKNSFATGKVKCDKSAGAVIGHIVHEKNVIDNVYALDSAHKAAVATNPGSANIGVKTAAEMKLFTFAATLGDSFGIKMNDENCKHPMLRWQMDAEDVASYIAYEEKWNQLTADEKQAVIDGAAAIEQKIADIGSVGLDKADEIAEARKAYDEADEVTKLHVKNLGELTSAEDAYAKRLDEAKEATPEKVVGVAAKATSYNSVKINWTKDAKAEAYIVYRYNSKKKAYDKIAETPNASYTDGKLATGSTYTYKVKAYAKMDGQMLYGEASDAVKAKPALAKVTNLKLKTGKAKVTVKWGKVDGASGYKIYRSYKKSSGFKCVKTVKSGKTTKFVNKKLKRGKNYYYKVRAYRKVNGKTVYGPYSTVKKVRVYTYYNY